ncbi:hypothetical protein ALC62_04175, partial [Cyphomyrmex costatus]
LNNEIAEKIARLIVADFPTEVTSTYYVSPIRKKESPIKKSIPARGKLLNLWRNRTMAIKKLKNVITPMHSTNGSDENNVNDEDRDIQASIHWLQTNQTPWELVFQHWHNTFNSRRANIETIDKWEAFFHRLTSNIKLNQKDDQLQLLMETLQDTNINEDSKVAVQISILPHLLPPKKMTRRKNKFWKPSIWNAKDSIIKHAVVSNTSFIYTLSLLKCILVIFPTCRNL